MSSRKMLAAISVVFVAASGLVVAKTSNSDNHMPRHLALDADKDGFISRNEAAARAPLAARFDGLDADKDGRLSQQELHSARALQQRRGQGRGHHHGGRGGAHGMRGLDKDGDGRISRTEAEARAEFASRFAGLDLNRDGFIDRADHELRRQQRRDEMFKAADSDNDGKLSRAEFDSLQTVRGHKARGEQSGAAEGQSRR